MGKTKIKESLGRMTCQFPKCTSNSDEEQAENVIFFKFPENPHLRKTWLKLLKLKKVPRDARICSKHFPVVSMNILQYFLKNQPFFRFQHMLKKRKVRNSGNVKINSNSS